MSDSSSPGSGPIFPFPEHPWEPPPVPPLGPWPLPPPRDRPWLHALLFVLVVVSTTVAGALDYGGFVTEFGRRADTLTLWQRLVGGLWFSVPALLILSFHEIGHYLACRAYRIRASLPYFIPFPPLIPVPGVGLVEIGLFGTLGAMIRIREPIRYKRQLFDIGIAGPLAGMAIAIPALVLGMAWSRLVPFVPVKGASYLNLGDPLGMQLVNWWLFTDTPGMTLNLHPTGLAAWFGFFLTGLNLIPAGQLDGGHVAYGCFGRRAQWLTWLSVIGALVLGVTVSSSWLFWLGFLTVLLRLFGLRHPPVLDEDAPLGAARWALAFLALVIFVLCFMPIPIQEINVK